MYLWDVVQSNGQSQIKTNTKALHEKHIGNQRDSLAYI